MTPQELKTSILQRALQGKQVPQSVDEGNGAQEVEKMIADRKRLIKNKAIKKEKELSEVSDDEKPYDVPISWIWTRTGNVGSWSAGATPSRTNPEYYGGDVPWLKTGDLNDGYVTEVPESITKLALEKTSVRLNPVGSVLMAMYGATIGKLCILNTPMTTNQACCACIPFEGIYNKYLFYFLLGNRMNFIKLGEGGAQPNISKDKIMNYPIAIPPLAEQHRIVDKIEELLPYIDRYEKAWSKLEEFNKKFPDDMQKSILQTAIQGKLVEQRREEGTGEDMYLQMKKEKATLIKAKKIKKEKLLPEIMEDEIPFDIPENWKWMRLREVVYNRGQMVPNSTFSYIDIGSIDNQRQCLNAEEKIIEAAKAPSRARKIVKYGDILYSTVRPYLHNMCIVDREFSCTPIASTGFATMTCHTGIYNKYLFYYLLSPEFDRYANNTENSKGVAYPAINDDRLYRALIAVPPLGEQYRIVAKLEEILPKCNKLK